MVLPIKFFFLIPFGIFSGLSLQNEAHANSVNPCFQSEKISEKSAQKCASEYLEGHFYKKKIDKNLGFVQIVLSTHFTAKIDTLGAVITVYQLQNNGQLAGKICQTHLVIMRQFPKNWKRYSGEAWLQQADSTVLSLELTGVTKPMGLYSQFIPGVNVKLSEPFACGESWLFTHGFFKKS